MTTYQSSGLQKVGFRVRLPGGDTRRTNTRAQAAKIVAARGLEQHQCQLLRIGRSRNGTLVDTPVQW